MTIGNAIIPIFKTHATVAVVADIVSVRDGNDKVKVNNSPFPNGLLPTDYSPSRTV
jgi:hypothetical protein